MLGRQPERRPARHEHPESRGGSDELADERRGAEQVLEVVEDEQPVELGDALDERALDRASGLLSDSERLRDGRGHEVRLRDGAELDDHRGIADERVGDRERESCLARASRAGQRDEPGVAPPEQRADRGKLDCPPDESRARSLLTRREGDPGRRQRGLVPKDLPLESTKLRRGLEPELVESVAGLVEGGQRLGLAARAVQRAHLEAAQGLAVRVRGDERLELGGEGRMPARVEIRRDARFEGCEPALLEQPGAGASELLVGMIDKGRPAPQRQRGMRIVMVDELSEAVGIELPRLDTEEIARRACGDAVSAERRAQRVHVHLQRIGGAGRRRRTPDPVDQPVGGDHLVGVKEEEGEQRARPRAAERDDDAVVVQHLQRPQHTEFHP